MRPETLLSHALSTIAGKRLPEGGFASDDYGSFRSDATALAALAFASAKSSRQSVEPACEALARHQQADGRLPVFDASTHTVWPTSLAILAWKKSGGFDSQISRAVHFLINSSGRHWPREKDAPGDHDTSIRGWPWTEDTHSWIEPTSLAVIALKTCGQENHPRIAEAVHMILDRQLPSGGWNCGSVRVFGKELLPAPDSTGYALTALAGSPDGERVSRSIGYLREKVTTLRTPLALSWAVFGLTAWSQGPEECRRWLLESFELQNRYGRYDTALLSQLVVAYYSRGDLWGFLRS